MKKSSAPALPKESVAAARKQVQNWFRHPNCSPQIYHFLSTYWQDMLTRAHAAAGEEGEGWQGGIRIAEAILWSITPKNEPDERLKLVRALPTLLKAIETAMRKQQASEDDIEILLAHMAELHAIALRGDPPPAASVSSAPAPAPASPMAAAEEPQTIIAQAAAATQPYEVPLSPRPKPPVAAAAPTDAAMQLVAKLAKGVVVEFHRDESPPIRCRLQWISPARTVFLFTSPDAAHAIRISPDSLAERIRRGSANILGDEAE